MPLTSLELARCAPCELWWRMRSVLLEISVLLCLTSRGKRSSHSAIAAIFSSRFPLPPSAPPSLCLASSSARCPLHCIHCAHTRLTSAHDDGIWAQRQPKSELSEQRLNRGAVCAALCSLAAPLRGLTPFLILSPSCAQRSALV